MNIDTIGEGLIGGPLRGAGGDGHEVYMGAGAAVGDGDEVRVVLSGIDRGDKRDACIAGFFSGCDGERPLPCRGFVGLVPGSGVVLQGPSG